MKVYRININGKDEKVTLPERWDEMTLGHMLDLEAEKAPTALEIFNVLAGRNVSEAAADFEDELFRAVAFVYSPPDWDKVAPPTHLVIQGVPYELPKIENETLGQGIMISELMARAEDIKSAVIPVLAIYFQPAIDRGKFDRHRLPAIEKMLRNTGAVEGFAVASHFMQDLKTLKRIIATGSPLLTSPRMRRVFQAHTSTRGVSYGLTT